MTRRHLTDQEISDLIDGFAEREVMGHAEGCSECQTRVAAWRAAVAMVAAPGPVSNSDRDQAVAVALAAGPGPSRSEGLARLPSRRVWATVGSIAAAALVLGGLAFVVSHLSNGHGASSSASRAAPTTSGPTTGAGRSSSGAASSSVAAGSSGAANSSVHAGPTGAGAGLGAFETVQQVESAVNTAMGATAGIASADTTVPTDFGPVADQTVSNCAHTVAKAASLTSATAPLYRSALDYREHASVVYVFARSPTSKVLVVVSASCVVEAVGTF